MQNTRKTFHSPGRFGDCIYQLYTVKALGGGDVYLSEFHTPGWSLAHIRALIPLLNYQSYIGQAKPIEFSAESLQNWRQGGGKPDWFQSYITHDLHDAENDRNPKEFPEWDGRVWPGNIHIAKRYAVHFGVPWDREAVWLEAPVVSSGAYDIVFHAPVRRIVRKRQDWHTILTELAKIWRVLIVGGDNDINEWDITNADRRVPMDFLQTATHINSAKLFLGAASSCNVIAEGLKQHRLVELADDCFNTYPTRCINNMDVVEVVAEVNRYCSDSAKTHRRN